MTKNWYCLEQWEGFVGKNKRNLRNRYRYMRLFVIYIYIYQMLRCTAPSHLLLFTECTSSVSVQYEGSQNATKKAQKFENFIKWKRRDPKLVMSTARKFGIFCRLESINCSQKCSISSLFKRKSFVRCYHWLILNDTKSKLYIDWYRTPTQTNHELFTHTRNIIPWLLNILRIDRQFNEIFSWKKKSAFLIINGFQTTYGTWYSWNRCFVCWCWCNTEN